MGTDGSCEASQGSVSRAKCCEEGLEILGALVAEHVVLHLKRVPKAWVSTEVVHRSKRTRLQVGCSEDHIPYSGAHRCTGAHGAGFERAHQGCVVEPPGPEVLASISHGENFRMGGWIGGELSLIVTRRDDLTLDNDECADGDVTVGYRQLRFGHRQAHEVFGVHSQTLVPNAGTESPRGFLSAHPRWLETSEVVGSGHFVDKRIECGDTRNRITMVNGEVG